jgi:oxygen-independent coproporphyrinogen-3 oxidase
MAIERRSRRRQKAFTEQGVLMSLSSVAFAPSRRNVDDAIAYARQHVGKMDLERIEKAGLYVKPFDYYVLGSVYPPLKAHDPIRADEVFANASKDFSLYVHVPFCHQYCTFCHFAKQINPKSDRVERYLAALKSELKLVSRQLDGNLNVHTTYFGGGTASYLDAPQIDGLFESLRSDCRYSENAEITFELHPGMINYDGWQDRLAAMIDNGVNRWVFGVQSMDDKVLDKLNRGHTADDVLRLLDELYRRNISNISIDLIFGLPYQTLANWFETLTRLVEHGVPKFNIFPLMFKIGDPITRHFLEQPEIFPGGDERMLMHFMCDYVLLEQSKFKYGPVFYYSKLDGDHSKQQKGKFEDIDRLNLLGLGVSAFGYIGGSHYYNECRLTEYMETVERGELPIWMGVTLDAEERLRREVMMSLRADGINSAVIQARHGVDPRVFFKKEIDTLLDLGLAIDDAGTVKLSKYGALHAEGIGMSFVSPAVREKIEGRNTEIGDGNPMQNLLERFDYSPIQRANDRFADRVRSRYRLPLADGEAPDSSSSDHGVS